MGLFDQDITNTYKCEECKGEIAVKQLVKDPWVKTCPFCQKETLIHKSGNLGMSFFIDQENPKSIGMLGQKNTERALKEGKTLKDLGFKEKAPKPWWRKSEKINYDVLKNPTRYTMEGRI